MNLPIASHELWWGAMAMDLGLSNSSMPFVNGKHQRHHGRKLRRQADHELYGTGGVMADILPNFQQRVKDFVKLYKSKFDEYNEMVTGNVIFQSRMKGGGHPETKDAISYGCTGPTRQKVAVFPAT